jgi:hypothetical protein
MFLYSCITPLHGPRVGTHSLQRLYSSTALYLQPSTALYSSTALHPLQYTTLYSIPQEDAACWLSSGCRLPASKQAGSVTCSGAFKAAEAIATCEAWTRTTTMQRRREILMSGGREGGGRLR